MTKEPIPTHIDVNENANIRFTMKGLWGLILAIVLGTMAVTGYMWKVDMRITELHIKSNTQHEQVMLKLEELGNRQNFFVTKQEMVDVLVYLNKQRDQLLLPVVGITNVMVHDELHFRDALRRIMTK